MLFCPVFSVPLAVFVLIFCFLFFFFGCSSFLVMAKLFRMQSGWLLLLFFGGILAGHIDSEPTIDGVCSQLVNQQELPHEQKPMTAVCLTGQLRLFSHVVSSIVQNLFGYLDENSQETHVYISSYLTDSSFLVHLLLKEMVLFSEKHPNVKLVRVHMPYQYPNTHELLPPNVRTGTDGTSALFNLTETCNSLILDGEKQYGIKYDTLIRTRIDGLWTLPPKNLPLVWEKKEEKNKNNNTLIGIPCLYHPEAFSFSGMNDRFSLGPRDLVLAGNSRLGNYHRFRASNMKRHIKNSETALRAEIDASRICTVSMSCSNVKCPFTPQCAVPFCLAHSTHQSKPKGGNIYSTKKMKHTSEGGKCYTKGCNNPKECSEVAHMPEKAFRALSFLPLKNCLEELRDGFLKMNTLFTSDAPIEDICVMREKYPSSDAFLRNYHAWKEYTPLPSDPPSKKIQQIKKNDGAWGGMWKKIMELGEEEKEREEDSELEEEGKREEIDGKRKEELNLGEEGREEWEGLNQKEKEFLKERERMLELFVGYGMSHLGQ